jgi:hemerythrin-like domain-containing protein
MTDVFAVLHSDHEEVKQMLAGLEQPTAGRDERTLAARTQVAKRLIIESSRHEAVEEQYFWPAVRQHLADGDQLADVAVGQEGEAKEVLAKLDKLTAEDPEFDRVLASFIPDCRAHIEFEETKVWPSLRAALSGEEASKLGEQISGAKEHAPTRPHPHTPASPGVLKTAGPAVAATDKLRDAVTGRGKADS